MASWWTTPSVAVVLTSQQQVSQSRRDDFCPKCKKDGGNVLKDECNEHYPKKKASKKGGAKAGTTQPGKKQSKASQRMKDQEAGTQQNHPQQQMCSEMGTQQQ